MARKAVVPIRFSDEERALLYAQANAVGLSLSEFVRRSALKRRLPPPAASEVNRATYQELCRIGNNVNQALRAIHERKLTGVDRATLSLFSELRGLVKDIGMQVLGVEA